MSAAADLTGKVEAIIADARAAGRGHDLAGPHFSFGKMSPALADLVALTCRRLSTAGAASPEAPMIAAADHDLFALARPVTPTVRRRIEEHIEAMVAILDELDAQEADLEPGGDDEPSLGWTSTYAHGTCDDREVPL